MPHNNKLLYASFGKHKLSQNNIDEQLLTTEQAAKRPQRCLILNSVREQDNRHCKLEYLTETLQLAYKTFDAFDIYIEDLAHIENLRPEHPESNEVNEGLLKAKARELGDAWWLSVEPAFIALLNANLKPQQRKIIKFDGNTADERINAFIKEAIYRRINCRVIRHTENAELLTELQNAPKFIDAITNTANKLKHSTAKSYLEREFASIFSLMINQNKSGQGYTAVAYPGAMPEIFAVGYEHFLPSVNLTWHYINFEEKTSKQVHDTKNLFNFLVNLLLPKNNSSKKNQSLKDEIDEVNKDEEPYFLIGQHLAPHLLASRQKNHETIADVMENTIRGIICAFAEYDKAADMLSNLRSVIKSADNSIPNNEVNFTSSNFNSLYKYFGTIKNTKLTNIFKRYFINYLIISTKKDCQNIRDEINNPLNTFNSGFSNNEEVNKFFAQQTVKSRISSYFAIAYEMTKCLLDIIIFSDIDYAIKSDLLYKAALDFAQGLVSSFAKYQDFMGSRKYFDTIVIEALADIDASHCIRAIPTPIRGKDLKKSYSDDDVTADKTFPDDSRTVSMFFAKTNPIRPTTSLNIVSFNALDHDNNSITTSTPAQKDQITPHEYPEFILKK